jgi:hypothetical protein
LDPQLVEIARQTGSAITGLAVWKAIGGKELVLRTVGPSLDVIGLDLRSFTERALTNLRRVIQAANRKCDPNSEGQVPPRILNAVLTEGQFCEDELAAEYLGGVLASSRVSNLRDDRAAAWVNLLTRLTSYQVRAHYIAYKCLHRRLSGDTPTVDTTECIKFIRKELKVLRFAKDEFLSALSLEDGEDSAAMIEHISHGLTREDLVASLGISEMFPKDLSIQPTIPGMNLFLWAHGKGKTPLDRFFQARVVDLPGVALPKCYADTMAPTTMGEWL